VVPRTAAYSYRLRLSDGGTLIARSVVITTGVTYRRLGVPRQRFGRKL
jgi:alkyl hydroperoxide reductase subunit AhpF